MFDHADRRVEGGNTSTWGRRGLNRIKRIALGPSMSVRLMELVAMEVRRFAYASIEFGTTGPMKFTALELCVGAGGQALGVERAGFDHEAAVDVDVDACETVRLNRPKWQVLNQDIRDLDGRDFRGIDLLAGGIPCPPFSIAGRQLGELDERDLFPEALRIAQQAEPAAIMLENVKGLAGERFAKYRRRIIERLMQLDYRVAWRVLFASDFGVPQLRPRFVLVALRGGPAQRFSWPESAGAPPTVGDAIGDLMAANGWKGASKWRQRADTIAPTLVGGSKKHGGPDLGPTRARHQWAELGVDGLGIVDEPPNASFPADSMPRLTVRMAARLQCFPDNWVFAGGKTSAYRQVGNAFPPPVARAVAESIRSALKGGSSTRRNRPLSLFEEPVDA